MSGSLNLWPWLWRTLVKVTLSVLCACAAYATWLAIVLLSKDFAGPVLRTVFWVAAPVVTAVGFAVGMVLHEHIARVTGTTFWKTLLWPLVGCSIGEVAVYWYGPMLIVFGMLAAGAASIVLREVALRAKHTGMRRATSPRTG